MPLDKKEQDRSKNKQNSPITGKMMSLGKKRLSPDKRTAQIDQNSDQRTSRTHQVNCVEYLHFSHLDAAREGEEAVLIGDGQGDEACGVVRRFADGVQHLHVADVVDVQALFQTYHQTLHTHAQSVTIIIIIIITIIIIKKISISIAPSH